VRYAGKKVLVTGGTGFIGGRLVERLLLEEGAHVRVLVRDWTKAVWVSRTRTELVHGDMLDYDRLASAIRGCDVVFDCASGPAADGTYRTTNIEGSKNLIKACRAAGVQRCVYVSSIAAHGDDWPDTMDETAPLIEAGRDYSDSKAAAEKLFAAAFKSDGFPVVTIRPTYVWGPRSVLFTIRPIQQIRQERFALVDGGKARSHAVYIDNLVDALLLAGIKDGICGEAFIITDDQPYTWVDLYGAYQHFAGVPAMRHLSSSNGLHTTGCWALDWMNHVTSRLAGNPAPLWKKIVRRCFHECGKWLSRRYISMWEMRKYARDVAIDLSKARHLLGYAPSHEFTTAMNETLRWMEDQYPGLKGSR